MSEKRVNPWLADPAEDATGQTFEIRTIEDLFKVPSERRRICLRELHSWMAVIEEVPILLAGTDPELLAAIKTKRDVFRWYDDGQGAIVSSISIEAQPVAETRSPEQIIRDGVAFITDTRFGGE